MWTKHKEKSVSYLMRRNKKWVRTLSDRKKKESITKKLDCNTLKMTSNVKMLIAFDPVGEPHDQGVYRKPLISTTTWLTRAKHDFHVNMWEKTIFSKDQSSGF